jgi:hypothetical protein
MRKEERTVTAMRKLIVAYCNVANKPSVNINEHGNSTGITT